MKNDKKKLLSCGHGISIIVVIIFLFGTLFPLFGNTALAEEIEELTIDSRITTTIFDSSNGSQILGIDNLTDNEPFAPATKVYGTVKYKDRDTTGTETPNSPLPIRHAMVKLFQYYDPGEIHIGTTYTSETGYFTYDFTPYPSGYEHQYFARVYSINKHVQP